MPVISVPGNSHYEAECHYPSSSNSTQASLTISGCSLTFSSVEMFNFVQMVFHRQQTKISKSGIRWSGNGFSQIEVTLGRNMRKRAIKDQSFKSEVSSLTMKDSVT